MSGSTGQSAKVVYWDQRIDPTSARLPDAPDCLSFVLSLLPLFRCRKPRGLSVLSFEFCSDTYAALFELLHPVSLVIAYELSP